MRFTWNEAKRRENLRKHGVDFRDAPAIFQGPMLVEIDARQYYGEERYRGIGFIEGRLMVVVFTERASEVTRIISLRKAKRHEQENFKKAIRD
jgi:uncharacterized DUF497 family protein